MSLAATAEGFQHLWGGVDPPAERFLVSRTLCCPASHAWQATLSLSAWGRELLNPQALVCPYCFREGALP